MADAPTVYVVDDDPGALRSLSWLIQQAGLPVRAFRSGQEFLESPYCREPGCLVLDVRMPDMGGLEVQQRLSEEDIALPIIFMTAFGDVPTCVQAFKAGAIDFLEKPVDGKVCLDRIRKALAETEKQKEQAQREADVAARLRRLTRREREVLEMLVSGKTLKEIAALGKVRTETIWKHRGSIFSKLQVENDVELVRLVAKHFHEHRQ